MLKLIFPQNQWAKGPHCNLLPRFPPVTTTHPCTVTSHIVPGCLIEYCRNDGTSRQDQVIKTQWLLSWSFSLSCPLVSLHVIRNLAVRSTNKELKLPANIYMSELRNRRPPPDPGDLQMTATLAHPQLSCSWISDPQKSWDNKCLLFSNW